MSRLRPQEQYEYLLPREAQQILFNIWGVSLHPLHCNFDPLQHISEKTGIQCQWKGNESICSYGLSLPAGKMHRFWICSSSDKTNIPFSSLSDVNEQLQVVSRLVVKHHSLPPLLFPSINPRTLSIHSSPEGWDYLCHFCSSGIQILVPESFSLLFCHPLTITMDASWFSQGPKDLPQVEGSKESVWDSVTFGRWTGSNETL